MFCKTELLPTSTFFFFLHRTCLTLYKSYQYISDTFYLLLILYKFRRLGGRIFFLCSLIIFFLASFIRLFLLLFFFFFCSFFPYQCFIYFVLCVSVIIFSVYQLIFLLFFPNNLFLLIFFSFFCLELFKIWKFAWRFILLPVIMDDVSPLILSYI